jgi:hypothetical protein
MRYYHILDNGGHPFKVGVDTAAKHLAIYPAAAAAGDDYDTRPILQTSYKQIFVGLSPKNAMTIRSGAYGAKYAGNTILVEIAKLKYIAISGGLCEFTTAYPIDAYTSPVGNNGVPYPYASDSHGNIYLINDRVVLHPYGLMQHIKLDPYTYYEEMQTLVSSAANDPPLINFHAITAFYIGKNRAKMVIRVNPDAEYDRLTDAGAAGAMSVEYEGKKKKALTKREYCAICDEYNSMMGFAPFANCK